MKTFKIIIQESWSVTYEVEAEDADAARAEAERRNKAKANEDDDSGEREYLATLPMNTWTTVEVPPDAAAPKPKKGKRV